MKHLSLRNLLALAALLLAGSLTAAAQSAGYDLLQTGSGASVDLTSIGLGVVSLQGVPIQDSTGNTDTIMHRTQDVPAGGGTVSVNVNALFMKSASSVTFQGQSADVYVTINNSGGTISTSVLPQPDSVSPSTGSVTVRTDGTFDSSITVNADLIFVKAGTSVTDSNNYIGHQAASSISLTSTNSPWSATAPPNYPSNPCYPSGNFFPQPVHVGPHPVVPGKKNITRTVSPQPATSTTSALPTTRKLNQSADTAIAVCAVQVTAQ